MVKCSVCEKNLPSGTKICTQCGSSSITESLDPTDTQRIYD